MYICTTYDYGVQLEYRPSGDISRVCGLGSWVKFFGLL